MSRVDTAAIDRFDGSADFAAGFIVVKKKRALANKFITKKEPPKVEMRITFDRFNPRAYEFARRQSSQLITEVGKATKDAVRTMIGRAFDEGLPPEALKRLIRERVGLRSDQLEALERYEEEGATPAQVDAYRRELLNDRAILIGRTETMRSANAGQKEMWGQAQAAGELPVNVKRIWIGTDDGFERPEHVELNDQVVGLNEPFVIPSTGREVEPGEDPNCRCGQGLVDEEAIANLRALAGQADRRRMVGIANQHRPAVARTFLGLWQSVYRNINQAELTNVLEHGNRVGAERLVLAALDRAERLALAEVGERLLDVMEAAGEATRRAAVTQGGWLLKRQPNQVHRAAGGPGSGNFGHSGRPGEVGGSGDGGGVTPDVPMDANLAASMREIERAGNWKLVEREKRDDYQETIVYNIVPRYMPSSVKAGGGGEFSRGLNWYDSALADLDEKGQAVPKLEAGTREFPLKVAEPGILYRGMSAGEFEEVRRTGEIISHGGYNLGGEQEGLTYFSASPDQASAYAAGFTPFQYEPSFGRPAYVVAVRDPGTSRYVAGTDTDERGIPGRVPASSIVAVYEGRVFQVRAGDMDIHQKYVGKYTEGGRMSPSTSRVWRQLPSFSTLGGPGSGNFGHAGRPGERGGSSSDGGGLAEQMQVKTLPPIKDKTGKEFTVMYIGIQDAYVAFDGNKVVSKVTMKEPNKVDHVFVDPSLRRRGIASAMYDRIEQAIGQKLVPSELQTDDGAALWRGRNKGAVPAKPKGKLKLKINESRSLGGQLKALAHDTRPPRKQNRFPVGVKFKP